MFPSCLERKGMSGIFFCQGCGASGDLAKIQRHQKSSARKSSIRDFNVVRFQFPKPICQGKGILSLFCFIIVTVRSCNAFAKAGTRNPRACFLACKEVAVAASNEIVHCILWKRRCVVLCVCVFVCDALMLCVCAVLMDASQ